MTCRPAVLVLVATALLVGLATAFVPTREWWDDSILTLDGVALSPAWRASWDADWLRVPAPKPGAPHVQVVLCPPSEVIAVTHLVLTSSGRDSPTWVMSPRLYGPTEWPPEKRRVHVPAVLLELFTIMSVGGLLAAWLHRRARLALAPDTTPRMAA